MEAPIRPGSLKCVIAWSSERSLRACIEEVLRTHVPLDDMRPLSEHALLVHTEASTEDVRDWLAPALSDSESLLVLEFERWSTRGAAIDLEWLRARGH